MAAHAHGEHVGAGSGGHGGEGDDDGLLQRGQAHGEDEPHRQQGQRQVADRQQRDGQARAFTQRAHLQTRADRHQADRQRRLPDARERGGSHLGQAQAQCVEGQAADGGDDQGIARQLAQVALTTVARQRPDGADVAQRHGQRHHQRHRRHARRATQALGQRQRDIGIEAKGHLRAGGVQPCVHARPAPQRQCQRDAGHHHGQRGAGQRQRPGGVGRVAYDRAEQQAGEQPLVDEPLGTIPHRAPQRGPFAQRKADDDEREIGEQQQGVRHGRGGLSRPASARSRAAAAGGCRHHRRLRRCVVGRGRAGVVDAGGLPARPHAVRPLAAARRGPAAGHGARGRPAGLHHRAPRRHAGHHRQPAPERVQALLPMGRARASGHR